MTCCLCGSNADVASLEVAPETVPACAVCRQRIDGDLDPKHWFGLRESVWSEVPAKATTSLRPWTAMAPRWPTATR